MSVILKFILKSFECFQFNTNCGFEILEISCAQWNGTFRLLRPDPSHLAFGYCSCKQDTKERYWEQQFCQMERDISVWPTEMTRLVKVDHLQSCSRIFQVRWNQIGPLHLMYQPKFPQFGVEWKALFVLIQM